VSIWNAGSGELISAFDIKETEFTSVAWEIGGSRLVTGSTDKQVRVWALLLGEEAPAEEMAATQHLADLKGHADVITSVSWAGREQDQGVAFGGSPLCSGSSDHTVKVWHPHPEKRNIWRNTLTLSGHRAPVRCVAWAPGGGRLASASSDETVQVWDAKIGGCLKNITVHSDIVNDVAWSFNGSRIASASDDKTAQISDSAKGDTSTALSHPEAVTAVAWCEDSRQVATGCKDKVLRIWELNKGTCIVQLVAHSGAVRSLAWTEKGTRLASGASDPCPVVWLAAEGEFKGQEHIEYIGEEIPLYCERHCW